MQEVVELVLGLLFQLTFFSIITQLNPQHGEIQI
jgi:hypothetical protein